GQDDLKNDLTSTHLTKAMAYAEQGQWSAAQVYYSKALETLPSEQHAERLEIRVERAKALLNDGKLAPAYNDLSVLVEELQSAEQVDKKLLNDAKASLAHAEYYLTWLLRLEGEPKDIWELEIESARQTFRMLA